MKKLVALASALFVLAGCSVMQPKESPTESIKVQIEVKVQGEIVAEQSKTIEVASGEDVLDAMKANYDISETNGLVTEISKIESDKGENKGRYWKLLVNDEMSSVGASDVKLNQGDKVTFDLTSEW